MNPEQLWETTMDPDNRILRRITIEDAAAADKMFSVLVGDAVEPRKEFIKEHSPDADWLDIYIQRSRSPHWYGFPLNWVRLLAWRTSLFRPVASRSHT